MLRAMGKKVIHMGDDGKGLSAKLAQNMDIVFIYEGLCESLTLAKKLGVPAEKMFELIESVNDPLRRGRIQKANI